MKTYVFTGVCENDLDIENHFVCIKSSLTDISFKAIVKASSLSKAKLFLSTCLEKESFSIDNFYTVTNSDGRSSVRFMKTFMKDPFPKSGVLTFKVESYES